MDGNSNVVLVDMVSGRTERVIGANELAVGTYTVTVQALDQAGPVGVTSRPHQFTVASGMPVLVSPSGTASSPSTLDDATPEFAWLAVPGAVAYEIWADNRTDGTRQVIREVEMTETSYQLRASLGEHLYQWQIKARGANRVKGSWSNVGRFHVEIPTPASPVLASISSPAASRPVFSWNPVDHAAGYYLFVINTGTRVVAIREGHLGETTYAPSQSLPPGDYRGWVLAWNEVREKSDWSQAVDFTVAGSAVVATMAAGFNPNPDTNPSGMGIETVSMADIDAAFRGAGLWV